MDELGSWQEQTESILVKVQIQIQPISGIQNKLLNLAEVCALPSGILAIIVHHSFPIPYPGDAWRHRQAPKEENTQFLLCLFSRLFL